MIAGMENWKKCIIVPVYNEVKSARRVIDNILLNKDNETKLIIVQDGSSDGTGELLRELQFSGYFEANKIDIIDHKENQGYGKALLSGFRECLKYPCVEYLLTMDCDEQHQPEDIKKFLSREKSTILSGSRYLEDIEKGIKAPKDRVQINRKITEKYSRIAKKTLGEPWAITDTFCGMKRYSSLFIHDFLRALEKTNVNEACLGYGFPLIIWNFFLAWLKEKNTGLEENFHEIAIPKIYISDDRTFGENLDFPAKRYRYYLSCMKISFNNF
jgi:dolichol-phosphate mannosyltransferase